MNQCSECVSAFEAHLTIPVEGHNLCFSCAIKTGALGRWYKESWGFDPQVDEENSNEELIDMAIKWRKLEIYLAELEQEERECGEP
jgi:hypothetical protein